MQNQNPNFAQQAGDFAVDAAVDTAADGVINNIVDGIEQHVPIPGGEFVDKAITTEVDQMANNAINNEVNKGVGGMMGDVEGLFGRNRG